MVPNAKQARATGTEGPAGRLRRQTARLDAKRRRCVTRSLHAGQSAAARPSFRHRTALGRRCALSNQYLTVTPSVAMCADAVVVTDEPGMAPVGSTIGPVLSHSK